MGVDYYMLLPYSSSWLRPAGRHIDDDADDASASSADGTCVEGTDVVAGGNAVAGTS